MPKVVIFSTKNRFPKTINNERNLTLSSSGKDFLFDLSKKLNFEVTDI